MFYSSWEFCTFGHFCPSLALLGFQWEFGDFGETIKQISLISETGGEEGGDGDTTSKNLSLIAMQPGCILSNLKAV